LLRQSVAALLGLEGIPKAMHVLWTIFVVLVVLWLLGFSFHIAGGLIHLLLVVALVILVINLLSGRRSGL
jgi:4-hydroxybenzoate polyprenyltransferase